MKYWKSNSAGAEARVGFDNAPLLVPSNEEGRQFLLEEGTDQRYGARHLKRAIER